MTNASPAVPIAAELKALDRRIEALQEWAHSEHDSMEKLFNQRVTAIEKAVSVAHDDLVRVPTDVEKEVLALRELIESRMLIHDERFLTFLERLNSVQTQFKERDTRDEQTRKDSKVAVDAAFAASKEAVAEQNKSSALAIAKSEAATMKSIDQQATLITSATNALNDKIEDLKERLGRVESVAQGRANQKVDARDDTKVWMAVFGVVLTLINIGFAYFAKR